MAKLAPRDIAPFLAKPDARICAVLLYGPDQGLVRDRGRALLRVVAGDAADPFRVSALEAAELRNDPARLGDEAAALSLVGGRRAVHVRAADDSVATHFRDWLRNPLGDSLVVAEAGELTNRSALRRVFESANTAVAIACYHDDARTLPAVVTDLLRVHGLKATADAKAFLLDHLGGDRLVTQREIEKLAHYVGGTAADEGSGAPVRQVDLSAAQACVGDSASISLDDLAFAVGDGDVAGMERALERSLQEGTPPVRALRIVARHLTNLHLVAGLLAQGRPLDGAIKALPRPVFWRYAARFASQAKGWSPAVLGRVIRRLLQVEAACKRTGSPETALAARALLEITANAPLRRGGPR